MNELANKQKCLIQRNGVQIWLDDEKAEKLQSILSAITEHKFIQFDGRTINTADCTGIYLPVDMNDMVRRKNGQYKCNIGNGIWHERGAVCDCRMQPKSFVPEPEYKKLDFDPVEVMTKAMNDEL